ncbi:MAG: hypothetical protein ABI200_08185 [Gaiellales bacterium]
MVGNTPGILPKAALVGSRAVYYPFTIPQKLNDSATLVGQSSHNMVKGVTASVGQAYVDLQPRGPAKWLVPLFTKTMEAVDHSEKIATRNKTVFWDPVSEGSESIGRAIAGPGAHWYLRKAGMEEPTADAIKGVLNMGLFKFPTAGPAPAPAPAPEAPPADAASAAEQAAQGAGEVPPEQ